MTPDEIQDLFNNIPQDEESRVQALEELLSTARGLQETKSPELQVLAEQVGNGSREGELNSNHIEAHISLYIVFTYMYKGLANTHIF